MDTFFSIELSTVYIYKREKKGILTKWLGTKPNSTINCFFPLWISHSMKDVILIWH